MKKSLSAVSVFLALVNIPAAFADFGSLACTSPLSVFTFELSDVRGSGVINLSHRIFPITWQPAQHCFYSRANEYLCYDTDDTQIQIAHPVEGTIYGHIDADLRSAYVGGVKYTCALTPYPSADSIDPR